MSTIIDTASVSFINTPIGDYFDEKLNSILSDDKNYIFGTLSLKFLKLSESYTKKTLILSIDMSPSMLAEIKDTPYTQQEFVNRVVKNMITKLSNEPKNLWCIINGFDDRHYEIQSEIELTPETCNSINESIDSKLIPRDGGTNIEIALQNMHESTCSQIKNGSNPFHILLTDGEAMQGETNPDILKKYNVPHVPYTYIGVGDECNEKLLENLASNVPFGFGDTYLLKDIEHSAIAIAKIISEFVNTVATNIEIVVDNAEIYNPFLGTWSNTLTIPKITHNFLRTFHLRVLPENIDKVLVTVTCDSVNSGEPKIIKTVKQIEPPTENILYERIRYIVLHLLYQTSINESWKSILRSESIDSMSFCLKQNLKKCYDEIIIYMTETSFNIDLLKRLLDDLYIASEVISLASCKDYSLRRLKANANESSFSPNNIFLKEVIPLYEEPEQFSIFQNHSSSGYYDDWGGPTDCSAVMADYSLPVEQPYFSDFGNFEELSTRLKKEESFEIMHTLTTNKLSSLLTTKEEMEFIIAATDGIMSDNLRDLLS